MSTTTTTTITKDPTKPIKLRSACNSCFSAKVRCDGNKQGCKRCSEKSLQCTYSESRVGKVVGKRRKRPLPGSTSSITNLDNIQWQSRSGSFSIPSPATTTNSSDDIMKRNCNNGSWTNFISYDDSGCLETSEGDDQIYSINGPNLSTIDMTCDMTMFLNNGLPTPTFSPTSKRFLSPTELDNRPSSEQPSHNGYTNVFLQPALPAMEAPMPDTITNEDAETICIKLLAHLKKHASYDSSSCGILLTLIKKANGIIRQLLRSKILRNDYTCQLLLSNIIHQLVILSQRICRLRQEQQGQSPEHSFLNESFMIDLNSDSFADSHLDQREAIKATIQETKSLNSHVGDLLKRRPLNGFQNLGRHECLHVELDQKLTAILGKLG